MKLAYVTIFDPNDQTEWSGLGHAIMQALRSQGFEVHPLGPLRSRLDPIRIVSEKVNSLFSNRYFEFRRERIVAVDYALQLKRKLKQEDFDCVFSAGTPLPVSLLNWPRPLVIWSGATYNSLVNDYGFVHSNSPRSIRIGNIIEGEAFRRASLLMFASDWAAQSATEDYRADPRKVRVVPFGANLAHPPGEREVHQNIKLRSRKICRLISVGVEWDRKGMSRAIELAIVLNKRGVPTTLTIVGAVPASTVNIPPFVTIVGRIDKRSGDGERRLIELLSQAHFHILFSTAECFGLALCEANACGVPNITSSAGGMPTVVVNGNGGWRFDGPCAVDSAAALIQNLFRDEGRYIETAERARLEYQIRLNWAVAGAAVKYHINAIRGEQPAGKPTSSNERLK